MQTNCRRIQMIVQSSTIFILKIRLSQSSSSSCIIRKPQYKWYVYTILLIAHFLFSLRPLFSLEAAVSVFASTPSTSMSFNDSTNSPTSIKIWHFITKWLFGLHSCVIFNTFRFQSTHFMVTKTNLRGISNYPRQNYFNLVPRVLSLYFLELETGPWERG